MAEVLTFSSIEGIIEAAATRWIEIAKHSVAERDRFTIALAGGSTPRPLYEAMARSPWRDQIPWEKTYVFFGDERRVPPHDERSNYRMAHDTLLEHVPVPQNQIFRMDGQMLARSAARDYENALVRVFDLGRREFPRFDLFLLGLGPDGHVASIFPGTRAVSVRDEMVVVFEVPQLREERMTMTIPVINNARHILCLVSGEEKADALYDALHGETRPSTYPAQAIEPLDGTLTFLVDEDAAAKLPT